MWNKAKNMRYRTQREFINHPELSLLFLILTLTSLTYITVKSSIAYYIWRMILRCVWSVILWVGDILALIFSGITSGMLIAGVILIFAGFLLFLFVFLLSNFGWLLWRMYTRCVISHPQTKIRLYCLSSLVSSYVALFWWCFVDAHIY